MVKEPLDSKIHTFTLILCDTQRTSSSSTTATEEITTHFQQKLCCQPGFTNYRISSPLFTLPTPISIRVCVCECSLLLSCVCLLTCSQSRSLARLSYHTVLLIVIALVVAVVVVIRFGYTLFQKEETPSQAKPNRTKPSLSLCK